MDIASIAKQYGIMIRSSKRSHKTLCPRCSHNRKNKDDFCLSVRIDNTGIGWRCFNCNWSGGELSDAQRASSKMVGKTGNRHGSSDAFGRLLSQARSGWAMPHR